MADVTIQDYYVRDSEVKNYKSVLVIAGKGVQSSEINDLQEIMHTEMKYLGDALYGDGSIITGGQIIEQDDLASDGITIVARNFKLSSALFYWNGYYIKVPESDTITLQPKETKDIGLLVETTAISPYQDTSLLDPAVGTRNYNQPGSWRLKVSASWSTDSDNPMFKSIYKIVEGLIQVNTVLSSSLIEVNDTIARYDYSANGSYVIDGLLLSPVPDKFDIPASGAQGYSYIQVGNGSAHVQGREIVFPSSVLIKVPWVNDTAQKADEVFVSSSAETISDGQHNYKVLTVASSPIAEIKNTSWWLKKPADSDEDCAKTIQLNGRIHYTPTGRDGQSGPKTYVQVLNYLDGDEEPGFDSLSGSLIPMIYSLSYNKNTTPYKYKCAFDSRIRSVPNTAAGRGTTLPYQSYTTIKVQRADDYPLLQPWIRNGDILLEFDGDLRSGGAQYIDLIDESAALKLKFLAKAFKENNQSLIDFSDDGTQILIQDGMFYDISFVNYSSYQSDASYPFASTASSLLSSQPYSMDYDFYKKRIDLLVLDSDGTFHIIEGTPELEWNRIPLNTSQSLKIGNIYNSHGVTPIVESDYYKTLKVSELQAMRANIKAIESTIANMQLSIGINNSTATNKLGQYTEAFLSTANLEDSEAYLLTGENYASIDTQVGQALCSVDWFGPVYATPLDGDDVTLNLDSIVTLLSNEAMTDVTLINAYQAQTPQNVEIKLQSDAYTWIDKVIENKIRVETVNSGHYAWRYQRVRTGGHWWNPKYTTIAIPPTLVNSWDETISTTTSTAVSNDVVTVPVHTIAITKAATFVAGERVEVYIDDQNLSVSQSDGNPTQFFTADNNGQIATDINPAYIQTPTWLQSGAHTIKLVGLNSNRAGAVVYSCIPMIKTLTYNQRQVLYWSDPVAQTIQIQRDCFLDSVELLFHNAGTTYVDVLIFENYVGLPDSNKILTSTRLDASQIQVTPFNFNQSQIPANPIWNKFQFPGYVKLDKDKEYSIVVMTDNTSATVWYSELSHKDKHTFVTLTNQPYDGVMLKSANSSTWTPFQESDLTFKLNIKKFVTTNGSEQSTGPIVTINPSDIPLNPATNNREYTDVFLGLQEYVPLRTSARYRYNDNFSSSGPDMGDFYPQEAIMIPRRESTFTIYGKIASEDSYLTPVISKDIQLTFGNVQEKSVIITKAIAIADSRNKIHVEFDAAGLTGGEFEVYISRLSASGYDFSNPIASGDWDGIKNCIKLPALSSIVKASDLWTMSVDATIGQNVTNPSNYFFQAGGYYKVKVLMKIKNYATSDRMSRPSMSNLTVYLHD